MSHRAASNAGLARGVLFALALLFWLLLSLPLSSVDGGILWPDVLFGILAAALVAVVMREVVTQDFARLLQPARYFWLVAYGGVLAWYVLRANLDVAYRVLHPRLPIRPGIVAVRTTLRTESARAALANSITLTPGTLVVDVDAGGVLYVHWINVTTEDEAEASARIVARFEWFIVRIFE